MNARHILASGIAVVVCAHTALAGSATWLASPPTTDWNTATNWNPVTVPNGPADVATFGNTNEPFPTLSASTQIAGIIFNPSTFPYSIRCNGFTLTISGAGMVNNAGSVNFLISSGAASVIHFQGGATAGNSNMSIRSESNGTVLFTGSSTGGAARMTVASNGVLDISALTTSGMTAGSIADDGIGGGFYRLGSKTLTVGGNNTDFSLRSTIADGGVSAAVGGSIAKVGTGTMTYAGSSANTYTGTTFVNEGTLVLDKDAGVAAARGPFVVGDGVGLPASAVLTAKGTQNIPDDQLVTVNGDGRFDVMTVEAVGALTLDRGNVTIASGDELDTRPLTMTGGTIAGPGYIYLVNPTTQATSEGGGLAATILAPVRLFATSTFMVSDGPGVTDLLIAGNIGEIGSSGIVKAGNGVMVLSGNNSFTGPTQITAGTLSISTDANLGTPPAGFTTGHLVFNGGTLRVTASMLINAQRGITLIPGGDGTLEASSGSVVGYYGIVGGAGGLTKTGPGEFYFNGLNPNTYTGTTTVTDGSLSLAKSAQSIAGPLVIGDGLGVANSAAVTVAVHDQIFDAAPVTIRRDGTLRVTKDESIGSLTVDDGNLLIDSSNLTIFNTLVMTGGTISATGGGEVRLFAPATTTSDATGVAATINPRTDLQGATRTFTVNDGPGAVDLQIGGPIVNGGLTKAGAGTLVLSAINTYSGPTTVNAGTLRVNGSIIGSATTVNSGGTLGGIGATGPLTIAAGGTLAPGQTGTLSTGNVAFAGGANFSIHLLTKTFLDQLNVAGTVSLGGARLQGSLLNGFSGVVGDLFFLILNDGTDPVSGTFLGLAQGGYIIIGSQAFAISYTGNNTGAGTGSFTGGNDVVLQAISGVGVPDPAVASRIGFEVAGPNPFVRETTLRYSLPSPASVRIELFDVTGHRVGTLVDRVEAPGTRTIRLDRGRIAEHDLPSGLYMARIRAGSWTHALRLVAL